MWTPSHGRTRRFRSLLLCLVWSAFTPTHAQTSAGCWTLQIGHFQVLANGERRLAQADRRLDCRLFPRDDGYTVQCGCYPSAAAARATRTMATDWPDAFVRFRQRRVPGAGNPDDKGFGGAVPATAQENDVALSDSGTDPYPASAAATPIRPAESRVLRPDQRRPADQFTTSFFGRPLTIGGEIELEQDRRRNFLLASSADDLDRTEFSVELDLFLRTGNRSAALIELVEVAQHDRQPAGGARETDSELIRGEMWYYSGGWFQNRIGYQLGRQNFVDTREWWWDANLDAVRMLYDTPQLHWEIALARELARTSTDQQFVSPAEEEVMRQLGWATWGLGEHSRVELFWLYQDDRSPTETPGDTIAANRRDTSDAALFWVGGRIAGRTARGRLGRLHYWADIAAVRGKETTVDYTALPTQLSQVTNVARHDIDAWGTDLGLIFESALPGRPSFYAGYARGSGDDDRGDGTDRDFRQTGLQGNEAKFRGAKRFRYYGELLDPELSNLTITTVGFGRRFWRGSSFDIVHHAYRQVHASNTLRDTRLSTPPAGLSEDIGEEWDVILAFRESRRWELTLIAARFTIGSAFAPLGRRHARELVMELTYNF